MKTFINSHHNMMVKWSREVIFFRLSLNYLTRTMHWSIYLFICNGRKTTGKLCRLMNRYASGCILVYFSVHSSTERGKAETRRNETRRKRHDNLFFHPIAPLGFEYFFVVCVRSIGKYSFILFVHRRERHTQHQYIVIEWTTNN